MRHLLTGAGSVLLISMLEKVTLFSLDSQITVVLLMWKWMALFLRKNLVRCWGYLSVLNWIGALTPSILLKLPPRKWEHWFILWSFFVLRWLCISINTFANILFVMRSSHLLWKLLYSSPFWKLSSNFRCSLFIGCVRYIFASLFYISNREHLQNKEKWFLFHFESSYRSLDNLILSFQVFKCHDLIKCLSIKHSNHFTE